MDLDVTLNKKIMNISKHLILSGNLKFLSLFLFHFQLNPLKNPVYLYRKNLIRFILILI